MNKTFIEHTAIYSYRFSALDHFFSGMVALYILHCVYTMLLHSTTNLHKFINNIFWLYATHTMDLIPYSFAPLVLFIIPYTLDLLP